LDKYDLIINEKTKKEDVKIVPKINKYFFKSSILFSFIPIAIYGKKVNATDFIIILTITIIETAKEYNAKSRTDKKHFINKRSIENNNIDKKFPIIINIPVLKLDIKTSLLGCLTSFENIFLYLLSI
jgi:hypothetical protein